jgi:hypothetical protein
MDHKSESCHRKSLPPVEVIIRSSWSGTQDQVGRCLGSQYHEKAYNSNFGISNHRKVFTGSSTIWSFKPLPIFVRAAPSINFLIGLLILLTVEILPSCGRGTRKDTRMRYGSGTRRERQIIANAMEWRTCERAEWIVGPEKQRTTQRCNVFNREIPLLIRLHLKFRLIPWDMQDIPQRKSTPTTSSALPR